MKKLYSWMGTICIWGRNKIFPTSRWVKCDSGLTRYGTLKKCSRKM